MVRRIYNKEAVLDGKVHRLDSIDDYIEFVLCFPLEKCKELDYRVKLLQKNGFTALIEYGASILGHRVIGKGYASITVLAYHKYYGLGLLKLRRIDSRRTTLEYEGMILDYLDRTGYTPLLYTWSREYVFMEYLKNCKSIVHVFDELVKQRDVNSVKNTLRRVLSALYLIDLLGVDHGEVNRPYSHILLCDSLVKIIDWESCSTIRKPHNLTSFVSYLLFRYPMRRALFELLGLDNRNVEEVLSLLRTYKNTYSIEVFKQIEKILSLSS
ncbi:MAG: serine/threonine protein kinase [Thermoprotei archaeon]